MSKSKEKGTAAETAALRVIKPAGFPRACRNPLTGNKDCGDLTLCPGVIAEVKNCKTISIPKWLREVEAEMFNAGAWFGFVVYKAPGIGYPNADRWPVVVRHTLVELLRDRIHLCTFNTPPPCAWVISPIRGFRGVRSMDYVTMTLAEMLELLRLAEIPA